MRLLELDDALLTSVGRQAGPLRHRPELFRAGADHQTDDLIGPLLIQPVRIEEHWLELEHQISLSDAHKAAGSIQYGSTAEIRTNMEKGERRECVGRVLLTPEDRQLEYLDDGVPELMCEREQRVPDHELDEPASSGFIEGREPRVACEAVEGRLDLC